METDLLNAWKLWFEGNTLEDYLLFGYSMMFWKRFGLILHYFGAFTIVLEIIGYSRLKGFSHSLKATFNLQNQVDIISGGINFPIKYYRYITSKKSESSFNEFNTSSINVYLLTVTVIISLLLTFCIGSCYFSDTNWILKYLVLSLVLSVLGWIVPILTSLLTVIAIGVLLILNTVFIQPFIFLLGNKYLRIFMLFISLLLISIGFHFNLLSS